MKRKFLRSDNLASLRIFEMSRVFCFSLVGFAAACGALKDEDKSNNNGPETNTADPTDTSNPLANSFSSRLNLVPPVAPPVEANTPASFKEGSSASLALAEDTDACNALFPNQNPDVYRNTTEFIACDTARQVQFRFFGSGPTVFRTYLKSIDDRVRDIFRNAENSYMPCYDEKNTAGGEYDDVDLSGNRAKKTFPAYALKEFSLKSDALDTGFKYYLSCNSQLQTASGGKGWVSWGKKDDKFYMLDARDTGFGIVASIDSKDNVEFFFAVGDKVNLRGGKDTPSDTPVNTLGNDVYEGSAALVHLTSNAASGVIEMTLTGRNIGLECGAHALIRDDALFIKYNKNRYFACSSSDDWSAAVGSDWPGYNASLDNLSFCLKLSGDLPEYQADTSYCSERGLTEENFKMPSLSRTKLKGFQALQFLATEPDVPTRVDVPVAISEDTQTIGLIRKFLTKTSGDEPKEVVAACNAIPATGTALSQTYEFKVADEFATFKAAMTSKPTKIDAATGQPVAFTDDEIQAQYLESLNQGYTTGAPKIEFSVLTAQSDGGSIKSTNYTLSAVLSVDGTQAGLVNLTQPEVPVRSRALEFAATPQTLTINSVVKVAVTGNYNLACAASSSSTGRAILQVKNLRLVFEKKEVEIDATAENL